MSGSRTGVLEWLRERRDKSGKALIGEPEYRAGERLREDFCHGSMMPRTTSNWSAVDSGRGTRNSANLNADFSDRTLAARERVRGALANVQPEHAGILMDVCCFDCKLSDIERKSGWPQRSGKVVLQIALRQLARHYGLLAEISPRPGGGALRHWGSADFRPALDPAERVSD